jgi:(5-formylfuran-3-yl)methyl phosphate synthase
MTFMLASVTGPEEAEIAVLHGADIIDLKDPAKGAFGAVSPEIVAATVAALGGRRHVSAVAGEIAMDPEAIVQAATAMTDAGVDYVKVALFRGPRREDCICALSALARRVKVIGVMFADHGADLALIPLMAQNGFAGTLIDTARKTGGRLLDHMDMAALSDFTDACRRHGVMAGLAGSLEPPDIPRLLLLAPDVLGFRGALCGAHDRTARLAPAAVDIVRGLIPADTRRSALHGEPPAKVDYRLLAARGYAVEQRKDEMAADRVLVRDFVMPIRVGAYKHEREKPQNVRFNLDVGILRSPHVAEDIRDVFSYDVIIDSIRMIVAQEHIELVETLAERIAALILTHHRVVSVTIRVEKLDVGPGAVGVEIVRKAPAEPAKVHHLHPDPYPGGEYDPKVVS